MADTPVILGPDGQPTSSALYNYASANVGGSGRFLEAASNGDRPYWPVQLDSINRLIPANDWRVTVAMCEKLVANFDVVKGALWSKAMFSVGRAWLPKFAGEAKEWGEIAATWLREQWYPVCNIRGAMHDFRTDLQLDSVNIDRGGDFGILLTEYDGGFPAVQRIPNWRIGVPGTPAVVDTVFATRDPAGNPLGDGVTPQERKLGTPLRHNNGVISNYADRPIYYRIRVDSTTYGSASTDFVDVHARDFIHVYDPEHYDQDRGLPAISASVGKLRDALQSHEWEQLAMLVASSHVLTEWNADGAADPDDTKRVLLNEPGGPTAAGMTTQTMFGGLYRFLKANSGAKIEQLENHRPGPAWEAMQTRIVNSAIRGINWSPMLASGSANPGGQLARADIIQCRASVDDRQDLFRYPAGRMCGRAVSKAINLGILPDYPGKDLGGFLKWAFSVPAKISIDDGNDAKNRRADYVAGWRTDDDILAELGLGDPEEHWTRRAASVTRRRRIMVLENRKPENLTLGVTCGENDMMLLTANGNPAPAESDPEEDGNNTLTDEQP